MKTNKHKLVCSCGKCNPIALQEELLWEYSWWLFKHNYGFDSDITMEEPYAVDEFLKEKNDIKNT